ncbi:hypothetical protein SapgrDRAFT_2359 [Saprospira grandis DSM 2844]|uniref:Secretion system C-terminal sorting domain-containing protein n=1 Tax=Saprospira grandis DSM 2844 TaxID=694433 RepID=J1I5G9_9BACT|nr:T9SS type A sorting domain-containing protein [Saprospira grandis]EJF54025.1 hypothetical protein SapgrDRAFT_2359 [Saprospira grandis DSM 2844]
MIKRSLDYYLLLVLCLFSGSLWAQDLKLDWAYDIGGGGSNSASHIMTDSSGNIYVYGTVLDSLDADPSAGSSIIYNSQFLATGQVNPSAQEGYLAKYDDQGGLIWAINTPLVASLYSSIVFQVSAVGDIYLAGGLSDTVDIDPTLAVQNLAGYILYEDANRGTFHETSFLVKYNTDGSLAWGHLYPEYIQAPAASGSNLLGIRGLAFDEFGDVYIAGNFFGDIDLDPGSGADLYSAPFTSGSTFPPVSATTENYGYLAKLNPLGQLQWAFSLENDGAEIAALAIHESKIYLAGTVEGRPTFPSSPDFDPSSDTAHLYPAYDYANFLACYSPSKTLDWVKMMPQLDPSIATARFRGALATAEGLILSGEVNGQTQAGVAFGLVGTDSFDVSVGNAPNGLQYFTVAYRDDASLRFGQAHNGFLEYMAKDHQGGAYIGYSFENSMDLAISDTFLTQVVPAFGTYGNVVARYDSLGQLLFHHVLANPFGQFYPASEDIILFAGSYVSSIPGFPSNDFDLGPNSFSLSSTAPQVTSAIAKYVNCRMVLDYQLTDVSCKASVDGSITATVVEGGTAPFNYLWSDNQTTATAANLSAGSYMLTLTDDNGCQAFDSLYISEPDSAISALTSSQMASCFGATDGSLAAQAFGGTAPYSFAWSSSVATANASNLAAGIYSLTITDAKACELVVQDSVLQPDSIELSFTATMTSCFSSQDGQAVVLASGGTAGYSFLWSNGETTAAVNNLAPLSYMVTVTDANGCENMDSVVIDHPSFYGANISVDHVTCRNDSDGSAMAAAYGGTPPYSYLWDDASATADAVVNNLAAGSYYVTVTDANGCPQVNLAEIREPGSDLVAVLLSGSGTSCHNSSDGVLYLATSGGWQDSSYASSWSNGVSGIGFDSLSNLAAGSYQVTVTDFEGCTDTASIEVYSPDPLVVNLTIIDAPCFACENGSIGAANLTGGTPPYQYSWPNGTSGDSLTNLSAGNYTLTITDGNGCELITTATVNEPPVSVAHLDLAELQLFPNPNNGQFNLQFSAGIYRLELFDGLGRKIFDQKMGGEQQLQLHIPKLAAGMYWLRLNEQISKRVIIK